MIGIFAKPSQIISETFELFKIPWEYYQKNRPYEVIIADDNYGFGDNFKLLIIFNPNPCMFDKTHQLTLSKVNKREKVKIFGKTIFLLNELSCIKGPGASLLETINNEIVAMQIDSEKAIFIRVAYNLFDEIGRLLNDGQASDFALIPSIDVHISLLRDWIINNEISLMEIPPKPLGYDFITCLTHDIDFFFLKNHRADLTMLGLLYRSTIGAFLEWINGSSSIKKMLQRWKFFFQLPLIVSGYNEDPWIPTRDYPLVEKGLPATYFFLPFKGHPGAKDIGKFSERRKGKYEVGKLKGVLRELIEKNQEIGVHGLDSWNDLYSAEKERKKISELVGQDSLGIRMHWLFFDQNSPQLLEKAGYLYDATLGYNDAVGYRNGTVQPFRFPGLHSLMELPLNAQDTAMLYRGRMGLKEEEAFALIDSLIENHRKFGGVLTLNWHDRSLAPERYWGNLYRKVLERLQNEKTLFCTAAQAVNWFKQRRAINFKELDVIKPDRCLPEGMDDGMLKGLLFLRLYNNGTKNVIDLPLKEVTPSSPNPS